MISSSVKWNGTQRVFSKTGYTDGGQHQRGGNGGYIPLEFIAAELPCDDDRTNLPERHTNDVGDDQRYHPFVILLGIVAYWRGSREIRTGLGRGS